MKKDSPLDKYRSMDRASTDAARMTIKDEGGCRKLGPTERISYCSIREKNKNIVIHIKSTFK